MPCTEKIYICGDSKNPLQHGGTSQWQRLLPGLKSDYIKVDEKDYADWIVFAGEFARYLNYHDFTGNVAGDWKPFFTNDISALLGTIAVQDIDEYRRQIKERFDFIKDGDNEGNLTGVKMKLHELFSALFSLSQALDDYLLRLPDSALKNAKEENTISLKNTLINLVKTKLAPALQRLYAYYIAADTNTPRLIAVGNFSGWRILNRPVVAAETVINGKGLSDYWWNGAASWADYKTATAEDESIFGETTWTEYRRINHASNHNLFSSVFDQYTLVYTKVILEAEKELLKTLDKWDNHPSHYALFLSFLKIFRFAQSHINTITQRHLDFYYKEVLRLFPKKAEPNQVHILVELAKQVDDYLLKQGTMMKAGKDSGGNEVLYGLDEEETFNKAKVALLKAVYKGDTSADDCVASDNHPVTPGTETPVVNNEDRLFASPVMNSDDGLGAELTSEHKEWHPFANKKFLDGELVDIAMPNAQIGFAIASHYLLLNEGERKIRIRLATSANASLLNKSFECYLTTEKEWYAVPASYISPVTNTTMTDTTPCAELLLTLPGDAPAVTNYNSEVHGGTFNRLVPVIKVYLRNDDAFPYDYDALKDITITKAEVKVEVGMESSYNQKGLKQLLVSNDFGPLDASKPFMPFGAQPKRDATFVIGNKEVFSKKNARIKINIEWADLPASVYDINYNTTYQSTKNNTTSVYSYSATNTHTPYYPAVKVQFINKGIWSDKNDDATTIAQANIFSHSGTTPASQVIVFSSGQKIPDKSIVTHEENYEMLTTGTSEGFMRLVLTGSFGHKTYLSHLTLYLLEKNLSVYYPKTVGVEPVEPYTPVIQSLYLSYSANTILTVNSNNKTDFQNRDAQFFHLYPFGEAEQHTVLTGATANHLLPQFKHIKESAPVYHIGEFYIGLEKLEARQAVKILFQVMEGTADPLSLKPDEHIHWSYLSNNQWKDFDTQSVSDATRQLIQSGIISFIIPSDATIDNTMLPAGYLWLRASVAEKAEAVSKLLSIDAQAAVVTFQPNNNAEDFLETALPAGTVSKLKTPDSAVKKINQPYPSFNGRATEKEGNYYIRISERLRHKARAITIWDYERLVLEAFPQIHKVKCLNHTKFEENTETQVIEYNEVRPGFVTIITVPDLTNRNDTNPLRPYTNQNVLKEIEEFLKKKISCHVKLAVRNPKFEEVRLSFMLKLAKGYDDFTFYRKLLREEITQYLTPWAYNSNVDIQFGGRIYKSALIDFIEERPYVDFITEVKMFHNVDDVPGTNDLEEVVASTARSILVSVPASRHQVDQYEGEEEEELSECEGIQPASHD